MFFAKKSLDKALNNLRQRKIIKKTVIFVIALFKEPLLEGIIICKDYFFIKFYISSLDLIELWIETMVNK